MNELINVYELATERKKRCLSPDHTSGRQCLPFCDEVGLCSETSENLNKKMLQKIILHIFNR